MHNYKVKLYKTEDISINPDRDYLGEIIVEQNGCNFREIVSNCLITLIPYIEGEEALFSFTRINLDDLEKNGYFLYLNGQDINRNNEVKEDNLNFYRKNFEELDLKKYLNGEERQAYQKRKVGNRYEYIGTSKKKFL